MKIDGVTGRIHPTQVAGQGAAKSDNTFAQVLDRAMEPVGREAVPQGAQCCSTPVAREVACQGSGVERQILQHASKVLDVLEEYAQALKNPQMTLKSIEPIVLRMQQELQGLDGRSMMYVGKGDQLGDLVSRIAVTAGVEAFKFQRGDYVA